MFLFHRITRELNPGIANFKNLEERQFLLGAIGGLDGKNVPMKFAIRAHLFERWITLSTDYHTIQRISIRKTNYLSQPIKIYPVDSVIHPLNKWACIIKVNPVSICEMYE